MLKCCGLSTFSDIKRIYHHQYSFIQSPHLLPSIFTIFCPSGPIFSPLVWGIYLCNFYSIHLSVFRVFFVPHHLFPIFSRFSISPRNIFSFSLSLFLPLPLPLPSLSFSLISMHPVTLHGIRFSFFAILGLRSVHPLTFILPLSHSLPTVGVTRGNRNPVVNPMSISPPNACFLPFINILVKCYLYVFS